MVELKLFNLMERLEAGHSARAQLLEWNGKQYLPTKTTVQVHDHLGFYGWPGDRGHCFFSTSSQQWEVLNGLSAQAHQPAM